MTSQQITNSANLQAIAILQEMRQIVQEAPPEPNRPGCLEDALVRARYPQETWWTIQDEKRQNPQLTLAVALDTPAYTLLCKLAHREHGDLWRWSDDHNIAQRLDLIDRALTECINGYLEKK